MKLLVAYLTAFVLFSDFKLLAEVQLPSIFGDHMVLQQGQAVPVWGKAAAGEAVTVEFAGKKAQATADAQGKWRLNLPALAASEQPQIFTVRGKNVITHQDVLVGEVWVCSGQSNMVASQRNLVSEQVKTEKQMRFFVSKGGGYLEPQENSRVEWTVCSNAHRPGTAYSAVGYYFAAELREKRKVPVGMIQSAVSGTDIFLWQDLAALEKSPNFKKTAEEVQKRQARLPEMMAKYHQEILPAWEKKHGKPPVAETPAPNPDELATGDEPPEPKKKKDEKPPESPDRSSLPSSLFNGLVHPHIPYAIKGVIWYQGESNAQNEKRAKEYEELMRLLITGWRARWNQGDFPFLFVQLPAYTVNRPWEILRNSQFKATTLPKTGMAVALDLNPSDNLHPPKKQEVGRRLSLLARKIVYGETLVASGPLFRSIKVEGNTARISFSETGSGLALGGPPLGYRKGEADSIPGTQLLGFQVATVDGPWEPATAKIEGEAVVVSSPTVPAPARVAYAWAPYPQANLYNKEGLPASPFRTDDAPGAAVR